MVPVGGIVVEVHFRKGMEQKKRLIAFFHSAEKVIRAIRKVLIEIGEHRDRDLFYLLQLLASFGLNEVLTEGSMFDCRSAFLAVCDLGIEVRIPPFSVDVAHTQKAVELVVSHVLGLLFFRLSEVPFARQCGHIAGIAKELGRRDLVDYPALFAIHRRTVDSVPYRQAPRHHRRPGGRTCRLRIGRSQHQSRTRKAVDVWCGGSGHMTAAVDTRVTPAQIIH